MTMKNRDELTECLNAIALRARQVAHDGHLIYLYATQALKALQIDEDIQAEKMQPNIDGLGGFIGSDVTAILEIMNQIVEMQADNERITK